MFRHRLLPALLLSVALAAHAQTAPPRAAMEAVQVPSHGLLMNGLVYVAGGAGPHPVVILLHGFPGNEQNLDLAQDMRRHGWDVLFFHYRGAWGSPGNFSFSHVVEDVAAALAYVRDPANAKRLRADPSRIVLVGHSMGGFAAIEAGAADPGVMAIGTISAADMAGRIPQHLPKIAEGTARKQIAESLAKEGMAPLAGTSPEALAQELMENAGPWRFANPATAKAIAPRPFLAVTSDDGLAPADNALADAVRADGDSHVTTLHLAADHAYSDKRPELSAGVLGWLSTLLAKQ